ncbi:sigma-70 family RNA polymerase sigma factor [Bacillus infantis]|uniref:sigma-70 family RNA polymerase sigma factor n=1 Tax=Bacillus infantis TaxID=324767 RepID=UPI003982B185
MKWELATDEQLWNIIANDWHVPEVHIEGLVTESLNRKLFNHLIKHLINKMFPRWCEERRFNFHDLYSLGYIGIITAMRNYKIGRGSFKTFAYMNIKTEFIHHLDKLNSEKRKVYDNIISLDVQKHDDNESSFLESLVDITQNPEKIVLRKIFFASEFTKLTDREKTVLIHFAEGYSMHEIAKKLKLTVVPIHRAFHKAINKINPNAGKVNLKELGLMTRTKGA